MITKIKDDMGECTSGENQFATLNVYVLLEILGYLDKGSLLSMAQTCKSVKSVVYHPSLWKDYRISYKAEDKLTMESALSFKERRITSLSIKLTPIQTCSKETHGESGLTRVKKNWQNNCKLLASTSQIEKVSLDIGTCNQKSFLRFPNEFNSLTSFEFSDFVPSSEENVKLSLENIERILQSLARLRTLKCSFHGANYYNSGGYGWQRNPELSCGSSYLGVILRSLPLLEDLSIQETGCSVNKRVSNGLKYPNLRRLCLNREMNCFEVGALQLSETFVNLSNLEINCKNANIYSSVQGDPNSDNLVATLSKLTSLQSIVIKFGSKTSSWKQFHLPSSLESLKAIAIRVEQNAHVDVATMLLKTTFPNLKLLSISWELLNELDIPLIISTLRNLEILSFLNLGDDHNQLANIWGDKVNLDIRKYHPNLVSLLGMDCCSLRLNLPPCVRYITRRSNRPSSYPDIPVNLDLLRKLADGSWSVVSKDSVHYTRAVEREFFSHRAPIANDY